jgi:hypothetical protein
VKSGILFFLIGLLHHPRIIHTGYFHHSPSFTQQGESTYNFSPVVVPNKFIVERETPTISKIIMNYSSIPSSMEDEEEELRQRQENGVDSSGPWACCQKLRQGFFSSHSSWAVIVGAVIAISYGIVYGLSHSYFHDHSDADQLFRDEFGEIVPMPKGVNFASWLSL